VQPRPGELDDILLCSVHPNHDCHLQQERDGKNQLAGAKTADVTGHLRGQRVGSGVVRGLDSRSSRAATATREERSSSRGARYAGFSAITANTAPCGSWMTAKRPTLGTSIGGTRFFAPMATAWDTVSSQLPTRR
jgi:hypothetical protein